MMRKVTITFLIAAISLLGIIPVLANGYESYTTLQEYEKATGKRIEKFNEAPMLRVKVAAGELPPVEERLPEEPLVVEPAEEIGEYGGSWRRPCMGTWDRRGMKDLIAEPLVRWSVNLDKIVPNVVKGWEFSEDAKSITFFLRKGMKWSDGAPFTADDFVFYWNDIALNKELNPVVSAKLSIDGEPGTIEKIDDYTFKLTFSAPYGMIVEVFANRGFPRIYAPKHYLKQFHPQYTSMDEIKKIMKREGYTRWTDFFSAKNTRYGTGLPVIEAWYPLNEYGEPIQVLTRNPYYWKVDTEGNQLPYIDKVERTLVSDRETIVLKCIAGEVDFYARRLESIENYPIVMQNREKGDYRVILGATIGSNIDAIYFNIFHKDPVLKKLFRDKRFRIALSIAINREEINQLLFKGMATPAQPSPPPGTPWYDEKFSNYYIEYNPEKANKILDEIGLKWDKNHEYRLRPDGKRLRFVNTVLIRLATDVPEMELVKDYWKKIGIEVVVKPVGPELWYPRIRACEHDVASILANLGFGGCAPISRPETFPVSISCWWAPMWGLWYSSGGKSGEEPPEDVKRLQEIYEEIPKEISLEKRIELQKEALAFHRENLWMIGTVREPPQGRFFIAKNNLRNVPAPTKTKLSDAVTTCYASQLFFKK